ncbi:GIY-YIG nuclease family protein [Verrucomicrobiota bacterium]
MLQSISTGRFYVGSCNHLIERFHEHQSNYSKATRGRGPWWMPYFETYPTRSDAQKREYEIKSKKSSRYIRTIIWKAFPLLELM